MKYFSTELLKIIQKKPARRNLILVLRFFLFMVGMVAAYSILFHVLMAMEGKSYTWFTGVYWTLTVMSTLGFGDITFHTDLGRLFSTIVLLSGMIWLLVMLPFVFIQFFYEPWMRAQTAARTPRESAKGICDHVVITHYGAVTTALIELLIKYQYPYVLLQSNVERATQLHDLGLKVVFGDLNDPDTYRKIHIDRAAMLVVTGEDKANTNIVFTVREMNETIPIVSTATDAEAVEVLKLAGSSTVLQLGEMMGRSLSRRMLGGGGLAHVIGRFGKLLIAEALCVGTPLVGKTITEAKLRETAGVSIVGLWERGEFKIPEPDMTLGQNTVLVLAGSADQMKRYDELFLIYHAIADPVVIIGGGRVGRATGQALEHRKIDYRIIEKLPERIRYPEKTIHGDAADLEVLKKAGIEKAPAVIITPRDDNTNVYLSIYCRRLRPDVQIISRATYPKNISTLHRAGADFVMSYASMGAHAVFNLLRRSDVLMLTEDLVLFQIPMPKKLIGKTIHDAGIRKNTGCLVVAIQHGGSTEINPNHLNPLPKDAEITLIGKLEAQQQFLHLFGNSA